MRQSLFSFVPEIKRPRRFGISVLMLFIVPDQRTVRITQGNRVDIAVVFFVVKFVDNVVLRAFAEPRDRSLNQFLRVRIVTGKQALSDELFSAAFGIIADGGGVHVKNRVVKVARQMRDPDQLRF